MSRIIISSPEGKRGILELTKPVVTLGRGNANDLVLNIAHSTAAEAGEDFDLTHLPALHVKGRSEPVEVFSVNWERSTVSAEK